MRRGRPQKGLENSPNNFDAFHDNYQLDVNVNANHTAPNLVTPASGEDFKSLTTPVSSVIWGGSFPNTNALTPTSDAFNSEFATPFESLEPSFQVNELSWPAVPPPKPPRNRFKG